MNNVSIVSPLESNGAIPVNRQDKTSKPIDAYFQQQVSSFTIGVNTVASTATGLIYTFTATTGHGISIGNEILLLDIIADISFYATVINVVIDVITVDRPIDHVFPTATTLCRITTSNMAVVGSLVTPQIFTVRSGAIPIDGVRMFLTTLGDNTTPDDGKFGNIDALENGIIFRVFDGFKLTAFNFKKNLDIKQFCYDVKYTVAAGPSGEVGMSARISFAGEDKHGVALRVHGTGVLQWIVQDDLTDLTAVKVSLEGHEVTD
jgi:hypothetical protein